MKENSIKCCDTQNEINNDVNKLLNLKKEIVYAIRSIDNPECQTLLELRYLNFINWEMIASKMGYSMPHIFRIHDKALNNLKIF